jgi:hypothetical protein
LPKKAFSEDVFVFSSYLISILNTDKHNFVFYFLQNKQQLGVLLLKTVLNSKKNDLLEVTLLINQAKQLLLLTKKISDSQKTFLEKYEKFLLNAISEKRIHKTTLY